ncbi:MAG: nickel pincer cofactor biosynthesis protein LarB [bacterium]|nr:nickel pincer cofactor biosynthesis protein LarB [bacterium]
MNPDALFQLLDEVRSGAVPIEKAVERLRDLPFENLGHTRVDHHRPLRNGFPEVIFGEGKTPEQVAAIARSLAEKDTPVIVTRAGEAHAAALRAAFPSAAWNPVARMIILTSGKEKKKTGCIAVLCAGTSDLPVAEEAACTAEALGSRVHRAFDVGVAGLQRLLAEIPAIRKANAVIAIAGMEGALPSVVAGLVSAPVIAVPTSVGYGVTMGGLTPLFAMLNSCASGLSVVNIDNGFGAACQAHLINQLAVR